MYEPRSLVVQFNHPVDSHLVEHMTLIQPNIGGTWTQDPRNPTIHYYNFKSVFEGKSITLHVAQGLQSTNNKTLLNDYTLTLQKGGNYQQYSRVKTYPVGQPILFNSDVTNIKIYRSNAQRLLSFLQYELQKDIPRGSVYDGTYLQEAQPHADADLLREVSKDTETNTVQLDPGVYYVREENQPPFFVVVSTYGATLRQDDKQVLLSTFDVQSGARVREPVTFGLYNLKNGVNLLRDFVYTESETSVPLAYPTRLDAVIGIYKDEVMFIPVEVPTSQAEISVSSNLDTDSKIFLYSDRPIYKPGDTVFIRGVIRQDSDALYKVPPAGTKVYYQINDREDAQNIPLTTDEFGTFSTHFVIDTNYTSDSWRLEIGMEPFTKNNYSRSYAYLYTEVKKYTKPEFEIKTAVAQKEYLRSEKTKFTISGNYFDGRPLANKEVSYELYRDNYYEVEKAVYNENFNITSPGGMCGGGRFGDYYGTEYKRGKVTLNELGQAEVEVETDKSTPLSQSITLLAKATDNKKNELVSAANTIVHAAEFNIFFIPSADRYAVGEEVVAPFYAESLSGEKIRNTTFDYELKDSIYAYNSSGTLTTAVSGQVTTDDNGKAIIRFSMPELPAQRSRQLIVKAKDGKNNVAENQKTMYVMSAKEKETEQLQLWGGKITQTYLKVISNQNSFIVGDTVSLQVESPAELDVLLTLERGRIYAPQFIHLNKGSNTIQFAVTEDLSPSITVVFTFMHEGKYRTEGLSLNAPAMHRLLQIGLEPDKTVYSPNETAQLKLTTRDANGAPVAAQLSLGIVDKAIYALRKSATPPIHSSFYYFRPRRTNASSSLTQMGEYGGGGGGGGGGEGAGNAADVLYWDPNVRTGATGETTISVPLLGYKTIWKALVLGSTTRSDFGQAEAEFLVK